MKQPIFIISLILISFSSCKKKGCTDPYASNYSASAEVDDGSCSYAVSQQTLSYGAESIQKMQLYLPAHHDENTKVILMVHGGGWVVGYNETDKVTTFDGRYGWDILNPLLNEGYACAVIKYRTACYQIDEESCTFNSNLYLDQMMTDLDLAIAFLKSRSSLLGIGDNHFQLLGESAGGHIVLSYALRSESDDDVVSVVSMFGPTALDDSEWKHGLFVLDSLYPGGILVDGINYFRTTENACELETSRYLNVLTELQSFGDHDTVLIDSPNYYLQEISPATIANIEIKRPIFIQQGEVDELVPASQANLMYEAYLEKFPTAIISGEDEFNGELKKMIYSNCGHGWIGGSCQRSLIMQDIVQWMNAH